MTVTAVNAVQAAATGRMSVVRAIFRQPLGVFSVIVLLIVAVVAVIGPWIAPYDPNTSSIDAILVPPNADHWLGTDASGRDVLSRLIIGTRYTLLGALLALVVSAVIGVGTGLLAGYYRRGFEVTFSYGASLVMALPAMVVLLAARAVLGPNLWSSMAIFGVIISAAFYRLTLAVVSDVRQELYVDAARTVGLSDARIISRHILTVVRAPVIIQAAAVTCVALGIQAGIEIIGLGDNSIVTWGGMLDDGFQVLYRQPMLILWPSIMLGIVILALTLFANVIRDSLERSTPGGRGRATATESAGEERSGDPSTALSVRNLKIAYGRADGGATTVVHDVSFDVQPGKILGLVGESGSGKTQTAFAILDVLPPGGRMAGGSITINGTAAPQAVRAKARGHALSYIPQEPMSNLDPAFTIGYQLTEPMRRVMGLSRRASTTKAVALLERVGIVDPETVMKAYPHQISGGMAQRILIAGAVASEPDILIADEPTTALDVTVQAEVLDLLRDLQRERNMAMVLVTHNFGVVADICDQVAVMKAGRVVEIGDVETIFDAPQHPYTRTLLAAILDEEHIRAPYAAPDQEIRP